MNTNPSAPETGSAAVRALNSARFSTPLLLAIILAEFFLLYFKASRKLFWFDELLTLHMSSLRPISLFWTALQAGVDASALGYYGFVMAAGSLPADPQVTLRLPSILGYLLTLFAVYAFTQRRLPAVAGLAAVVFVTLSPFRDFAVEARCYALLVGFLAMSALCWQNVDQKRFMTPLFALFLMLAVSCHHLAVISISVFCVAELAWTIVSRRIRWWIWGGCALASFPFFLNLPLLIHLKQQFGAHFWSPSSWIMMVMTYGYYLGLPFKLAVCLLALFGLTTGASWRQNSSHSPATSIKGDFSLPETVLVAGFLAYPALLVAVTTIAHSGYTARYGWPAIFGFAIGFVYLLRTYWRETSSVYLLSALLVALAAQGSEEIKILIKQRFTNPGARWTVLAELSRAESSLPVVIANAQNYLEATRYAPQELRPRLARLVDPDVAVRLTGTDTDDLSLRLLARFVRLRVEDLAPFQAGHDRFILYSGGPVEWLTRYLIEKGYHLGLLGNDGEFTIYMAER